MMGSTERHRGLTLVELMVVLVILGFSVGFVTLNLSGQSERNRLESAAREVAAVFRLGKLKAAESGLPYVVRLDRRSCSLHRPEFEEDVWIWRKVADFAIAGRVAVECVTLKARDRCDAEHSAPWQIPLNAGGVSQTAFIRLATSGGVKANVTIDGLTGFEEFELIGNGP